MNPIILEFYFGMLIGYFTLKNKFMPCLFSVAAACLSLAYLFFASNILNLPRVIESGVPAALLVWSIVSLEVYLQGKIPRLILFYGAASYALYLFHPLILPVVPTILKKISVGSLPLSVSFSVIIALTASAVIHRWYERPLTNIIRNNSRESAINHTSKIS